MSEFRCMVCQKMTPDNEGISILKPRGRKWGGCHGFVVCPHCAGNSELLISLVAGVIPLSKFIEAVKAVHGWKLRIGEGYGLPRA